MYSAGDTGLPTTFGFECSENYSTLRAFSITDRAHFVRKQTLFKKPGEPGHGTDQNIASVRVWIQQTVL